MSQETAPIRTPLSDLHIAAGGKMVEFAGWSMPVQYSGILAEHHRVRGTAASFDLSHMGRLYVTGPDAETFLQLLTTNDVSRLAPGQIQYSLICNLEGGVRDDVLVYRLAAEEYLLVVNASNREKILEWMDRVKAMLPGGSSPGRLKVEDRTFETVMIGVQGPDSPAVLQRFLDLPLERLGYYRSAPAVLLGAQALLSRTGYTGEDGFEIILPVEAGRRLWAETAGAAPPAGLGARDTLRLEAGMPLYGHELAEDISPLEAGLTKFVRFDKGDFAGRDALQASLNEGVRRRLIGLDLQGRVVARQGTPIMAGSEEVGRVTSGTFSPTFGRGIAMALVRAEAANAASFHAVIRGDRHEALAVPLPFYRRDTRQRRTDASKRTALL